MITEYIDCTEFKRLIADKKIKPVTLKYYLRKKGIIFTASNPENFAEQIYTIFLGTREISDIKDMMLNELNYEKSLVMNLACKESEEDIIDIIVDEINQYKSVKTKNYIIERPKKMQQGIYLQISYERKLPGRNKLLEKERRSLKIHMRKISSGEVVVDIRQQSSIDSKKAVEFIEAIAKSQDNLQVHHFNLDTLVVHNKVEFFDRIASYKFELWNLITITSITVKQGNTEEDEDDEVLMNNIDHESTLNGISQAVLNGSGLRTNEFVQKSIEKGYYISAMRYRYEHKINNTEFAVVLSFKNKDLRVDIDKTYLDDNGKKIVQPLIKSEQSEIIESFQKASYEIFNDLQENQQR